MIQFHKTGYGKRYYEHQLPELTRQLARVADALEKQNEMKSLARTARIPKAPKPVIYKRENGNYELTINKDKWLIYKDKFNRMGAWRAECTLGSFKDKHNFKEPHKKDVLASIHQLYENTNDTRTI
jgi:hypothetical protein